VDGPCILSAYEMLGGAGMTGVSTGCQGGGGGLTHEEACGEQAD
jgi:hypothetical protein